ncbi:MAG: hypothetical protein ACXABG_07065 [Promethearchaeota archaeon]
MELIDLANESFMLSNYDKAINYSEKVIRLAIKSSNDSHITEQQQFLIKIAKKVEETFFISEINDAVNKIGKIYHVLIEARQFSQAHEILETFKSHYQDKIDLDSIPLVKELFLKDMRENVKNSLE